MSLPELPSTNLPTKTWKNPRWATTPDWARPILQSLEQFLARPTFNNGVTIGDGEPPTRDVETGVITQPPTTGFAKQTIAAIDTSLTSLGVDIDDVYTTLAGMEEDLLALSSDPIAFTRITGVSISTPMLQANSVTATQLAAMALGVGKYIASTSYSAGSSGWIIDANGTAEFNSVTIRGGAVVGGTITAAQFATGGSGVARVVLDTDRDRIKFFNSSDVLRGYISGSGGLMQFSSSFGFAFDRAVSITGTLDVSSTLNGAAASFTGSLSTSSSLGVGGGAIISGSVAANSLSINGGNATISSAGAVSAASVSANTIVLFGKSLSSGAPDSAGTGFRQVRVPN